MHYTFFSKALFLFLEYVWLIAEPVHCCLCLFSLLLIFVSFRKPLPKIDSSTLGVNELDLKIQETRIMEKVCKVY